MPFLIAAAAIIVFFLWRYWAADHARAELSRNLDPVLNRMKHRKPCKWEKAGHGKNSFEEYRCKKCGVTAYSRGGKPPQECKRNLKSGL